MNNKNVKLPSVDFGSGTAQSGSGGGGGGGDVEELARRITDLEDNTVNGKLLSTNPILSGEDIKLKKKVTVAKSGEVDDFFKQDDTVKDAADKLLQLIKDGNKVLVVDSNEFPANRSKCTQELYDKLKAAIEAAIVIVIKSTAIYIISTRSFVSSDGEIVIYCDNSNAGSVSLNVRKIKKDLTYTFESSQFSYTNSGDGDKFLSDGGTYKELLVTAKKGKGSFSEMYNIDNDDLYDKTEKKADGYFSHAEGYATKALGGHSHAEGSSTTAKGNYSHAEGGGTKALGDYSHVEGESTEASGRDSHAEGKSTNASNTASHAEGIDSRASGYSSHAEGGNTSASAAYSHAEGGNTVAGGEYSHAEGNNTKANGKFSHTEGNFTETNNETEHASGEYNKSIADSADKSGTLFSVGNGTAEKRKNAFEITKNGDIYFGTSDEDKKIYDAESKQLNAEYIPTLPSDKIDGLNEAIDIKIDTSASSLIDKKLNGIEPVIISSVEEKIDDKIAVAVSEKITKPFVIQSLETVAGTFKIGKEDINIYERAITLSQLPTVENTTKEYVISEEPLGIGLYLNVDSFIASSGKGLNKEFFNFNYEITRFYVNDKMQSCAVIKCKNTVSEAVNGLIHLRYCKFFGDVLEINVNGIKSNVNKNAVSLEFPPLKFNKKIAFSYITDDSNSIYQYIFNAINKRKIPRYFKLPDGRQITYHYGMDNKADVQAYMTDPYYPDHFAQCTDGAGIPRRYATTVACWADKLIDQYIGMDVDFHYPWISEKEAKFFFDFGFMTCYHDLLGYETSTVDTQEKFDVCMKNTAEKFLEAVGIIPKIMAEPNGDHKYITFCRENDTVQAITAQGGESSIKMIYPFKEDMTLDKSEITIQRIFAYGSDLNNDNDNPQYAQDLLQKLADNRAAVDKNQITWIIGSAHKCSHWETVLIKTINERYGAIGDDSLWFPTLDEFYEYWYMRKNTTVIKEITDTGIKFKLYVPNNASFFFRDLSVMLNGIDSVDGITVESSDNIYGESHAISDGKLLVNLNFNKRLFDNAQKYLDIFKNDETTEYAYDNAKYFIQQLKPLYGNSLNLRLEENRQPPVIGNITCPTTTKVNPISITIAEDGIDPKTIVVTENGVEKSYPWESASDNSCTISHLLSQTFEEKTLLIKLVNDYGESEVKTVKVILEEPDLVLNAITINGIAPSTTEKTVKVKFIYTGYPTHYMLSESPDFTGAQWLELPANGEVNFDLSDGFEEKTVYGKLKSSVRQSVVKSDTITYLTDNHVSIDNVIVLNTVDGNITDKVADLMISTTNSPSKYKISRYEDFRDCVDWIELTSDQVVQIEGQTKKYNTTIHYIHGFTVGAQFSVNIKVANQDSESLPVLVNMKVLLSVKFDRFTLASDSAQFTGLSVPVTFNITQGKATHYMLSESASFANGEWKTWSDSIEYKFISEGQKTLYGKLKNEVGESEAKSDDIEIIKPIPTAIVSWSGKSNQTNTQILYNVQENGDIINMCKFSNHTSYNRLQFKDKYTGELLNWYYNQNSSKYLKNSVFVQDGSNNYQSVSTAVDGGVYPASEFDQCISLNAGKIDGTGKMRISFYLPAGTYKMKILYSPADNFLVNDAMRDNCYYGIYQGETELMNEKAITDPTFTGKGVNDWSFEGQFTVPVDGDVDFAAWIMMNQNYRPGVNLLELSKIS